MDDIFLIQRVISLFNKSIASGFSQTNHHLLILNGHGSHVMTLETIKQAQAFKLDMIILPSHTSQTSRHILLQTIQHNI
jgi:creatinine amidohydrolase/Fe(II)-dependent formamide hydrolase-like protein